jgi:integrase
VPLSRQALEILTELYPLTGPKGCVFPSILHAERSIGDNTINLALRRLCYDRHEVTAHGFRSISSTLLNEKGWNSDAIERQLSHCERIKIRGTYNFAEYLSERRKMMQAWADYLDELRLEKVVPAIGNAA